MDFPKCGNLPGDPPCLPTPASRMGQVSSKASDLDNLELMVDLV